MRNLLRRDRDNLEQRLRDERPEPSDALLRRLSGSTQAERAPRRRFGLVLALTAMIVLAFSLTGGIGYAASSASKGTHAVKQIVTGKQSSSGKNTRGNSGHNGNSGHHGSSHHQYEQKVLICHNPTPRRPHFGQTLSVAPAAVPAHLGHGDYLGPCHS